MGGSKESAGIEHINFHGHLSSNITEMWATLNIFMYEQILGREYTNNVFPVLS